MNPLTPVSPHGSEKEPLRVSPTPEQLISVSLMCYAPDEHH